MHIPHGACVNQTLTFSTSFQWLHHTLLAPELWIDLTTILFTSYARHSNLSKITWHNFSLLVQRLL